MLLIALINAIILNYIWVNLHKIVNTHLLLELVSSVAQADGKFFMSTQIT